MASERREPARKLHLGRVLLVYVAVGVALGCLSAAIQGVSGAPPAVGAGLACGALVLVAPVLNWLVRSGRASWLLKE